MFHWTRVDQSSPPYVSTGRARPRSASGPAGRGRDAGLVFVNELGNELGEPYRPDCPTRTPAAFAFAAGLPRSSPTPFAMDTPPSIEAGVPMKVVQERLGHSSIAITSDIYSRVRAPMDQPTAAQVAAAIDGL